MQIALDPAAGGIADGHNPRPGSGQLGRCLCVDDRGTEHFGESGQLLLGPGRHPGAGLTPTMPQPAPTVIGTPTAERTAALRATSMACSEASL
jgi:hypothetical protein